MFLSLYLRTYVPRPKPMVYVEPVPIPFFVRCDDAETMGFGLTAGKEK